MRGSTLEAARAVKEQAHKLFSDLAPVNGVGITRFEDGYGVKINLSEHPAPDTVLPTEVDGVPVRVDVVGPIRKL